MVGDWVLAKGKPFRVDEIHNDGISPMWDSNEVYGYEYGWEDIEPIPLTSDILEKNGWIFDEIDGSFRHPDNRFWVGGRGAPFGFMISNLYQECKYVHELQHALKSAKIKIDLVI